jgi:hypothetical protein
MVNQGSSGRFEGYRVNCEFVPCLPARVVADCLVDPRRIPYLLIWTRRLLPIERGSLAEVLAEPREAVRLARSSSDQNDGNSAEYVEVERWNGRRILLRVVRHRLPRHGGNALLLLCDRCEKPRRTLYGREAIKAARYIRPADWICRTCANLNYASEGGALIYRTRWAPMRKLSGLPLHTRPEPWEPRVFTSPVEAYEWGYIQNLYLGTANFAVAQTERNQLT